MIETRKIHGRIGEGGIAELPLSVSATFRCELAHAACAPMKSYRTA